MSPLKRAFGVIRRGDISGSQVLVTAVGGGAIDS